MHTDMDDAEPPSGRFCTLLSSIYFWIEIWMKATLTRPLFGVGLLAARCWQASTWRQWAFPLAKFSH